MDYQIVATLGPSSQSESLWRGMLAAGGSELQLGQVARLAGRHSKAKTVGNLPAVLAQGSRQ